MSGSIYLGPDEPLDWLRGFIGEATSERLIADLRELAERIRDLEPLAIKLLMPDDSDPDCPAEFRISNDGNGIPLNDLGRHSSAARWAIRGAVVRGWRRHREVVPTAAHRAWAEGVQMATRKLLGLLRTAKPRDLMALQRGGLSGGSRMLPARPELDGKGWLVIALESLDRAAGADLRRLGDRNGGDRQPDLLAGAEHATIPTAAHDAIPIWLHFRPDEPPTSNDGKRETGGRTGSFVTFVELLHNMATGRSGRYVRRDVQAVLKEYSKAIDCRYGRPALARLRTPRQPRRG
jgi:hypothetical protein